MCHGGAIVPRRPLGEAETPDVPSLLFAGVGDKDVTACLCGGGLAGWQQVIGRGRALDVPWAKGGRLVSCGHRSSQPARLSDTSMPVVSLAIHTQTLSLSHSSLFTPQTHCRREYTPFSTAQRPSIGSDPLPPLLLLPCLPSSTLSGLLPHLPFPGSTKHDLMI